MTVTDILVMATARASRQDRTRFTFDPATGALVVTPELDRKIRKALKRAARSIAFRLCLSYPRIYLNLSLLKVRKLFIKGRIARLHILRFLAGDLLKL
jgi:hypothetical protein